jgi:hypothetical protein
MLVCIYYICGLREKKRRGGKAFVRPHPQPFPFLKGKGAGSLFLEKGVFLPTRNLKTQGTTLSNPKNKRPQNSH